MVAFAKLVIKMYTNEYCRCAHSFSVKFLVISEGGARIFLSRSMFAIAHEVERFGWIHEPTSDISTYLTTALSTLPKYLFDETASYASFICSDFW